MAWCLGLGTLNFYCPSFCLLEQLFSTNELRDMGNVRVCHENSGKSCFNAGVYKFVITMCVFILTSAGYEEGCISPSFLHCIRPLLDSSALFYC
jgi:hypothetical protein